MQYLSAFRQPHVKFMTFVVSQLLQALLYHKTWQPKAVTKREISCAIKLLLLGFYFQGTLKSRLEVIAFYTCSNLDLVAQCGSGTSPAFYVHTSKSGGGERDRCQVVNDNTSYVRNTKKAGGGGGQQR